MNIELREVNQQNFDACIDLEVTEEQKQFVAPNIYSIAQAKVFPEWSPLCIYQDDQLVGFTLFGIDPEDQEVWISRLMVDARYQKQGIGKAALLKVIEMIKSKYDRTYVYLSTEPENEKAQQIYESIGFINTGKIICDEVVFKLRLK